MIELIINGETVIVKDGMTVLEVAKAAGIYIPSLCYHPYISPAGTCRLCAVEVEGMRGLPCSCTLPATEGMVVHADTPRVREFRRTLLECILSEHPRDCLVCPANLQCELQEVAAQIELERARLPSIPRSSQPKEDGIFFKRDYSLCIRCGRCVRVCHELRGNKAIYFLFNEKELSVGTPLNRSLQDSGCAFCGACVDICPTGALDFGSIIEAIGQIPDVPSQFGLKIGKNSVIEVREDTLATDHKGVYAGGDVVLGPASVIEAIAQGRKAASAITTSPS